MQTAASTAPKRLKILSADEMEAIYERPHFTHEERMEYFALSPPEKAAMEQLHSIKSRLHYILQLGYFKARHLFFSVNLQEVEEDAKYIQDRYFPNFQLTDLDITKVTRLKQRQLILELFNHRPCDAEERKKIEEKARSAARVSSKPIYIFRELMTTLSEQRIMTPSYSSMQDLIGNTLMYEQNRLMELINTRLNEPEHTALKSLLTDTQGLYEITLLKREPRDFSLGEIKREIERGEQIDPLYHLAQKLLPALEISNENIKYYASLVTYYSVFRLKQLDEQIVYLYLLCFIHYRYQRRNDNLLKSLIHKTRGYTEETKSAAKERVYEYRVESNQNLQKAGRVLKLFTDDTIAEDTPFQEIQTKAFEILDRQKLDSVADQIATKASFDETAFQWEHSEKLARQFKRNLRPILATIEFAAPRTGDTLIEATHFLKKTFQEGKALSQYPIDTFPMRFVPDQSRRYLYVQDTDGQKSLGPDRYEFLVYRLLRNGLEAGDISCRDSVHFRSFEDDLIGDEPWQNRDELFAETGLTILQQSPEEHLALLEQQLEERIVTVNQRIVSRKNEHIQFKNRGKRNRWTLQYPHSSDPINHPFFDSLRQVDIGNVLQFVNRQCHFMEAFEHVLGRYAKQDAIMDPRI